MEGEGDVTYRIVHWDQRLLAQHHKKPAGPLFDIKCRQQSVCQLHLPHCEIRSTGACQFLSVAHVTDEGTEFIFPHEITETHVVINITGFSRFGVARDKNSPPYPIKAAVFLFYTPPVDSISLLNVLLLPGNVVLRDVQNQREKRNACERYIEVPPQCRLYPKQKYVLSASHKDTSIRIQPKKAEFDCENYHNFLTTFQVILKDKMESIKLLLRDRDSSHCVWRNRVYLSSAAVRRPQVQGGQDLTSVEILRSVWEPFINRVSGPMLKSLLDRLHHNGVISKSEREAADVKQNKTEMASFGISMVMDKGERASLEMITFLCEEDKYLSETLGLM
uniref:FIIND domain-containing protein n=1 Tax=Myripristis murdjan TaxID=586833 RepID=A0A667YML2_9TELE